MLSPRIRKLADNLPLSELKDKNPEVTNEYPPSETQLRFRYKMEIHSNHRETKN